RRAPGARRWRTRRRAWATATASVRRSSSSRRWRHENENRQMATRRRGPGPQPAHPARVREAARAGQAGAGAGAMADRREVRAQRGAGETDGLARPAVVAMKLIPQQPSLLYDEVKLDMTGPSMLEVRYAVSILCLKY